MAEASQTSDAMAAQLLHMVSELQTGFNDHRQQAQEGLSQVQASLGSLNAMVEKFQSAFPEGDYDKHREYHESLIARAQARAEFWKKLSFELSKYGLLGFTGWALYHLWLALINGPKPH